MILIQHTSILNKEAAKYHLSFHWNRIRRPLDSLVQEDERRAIFSPLDDTDDRFRIIFDAVNDGIFISDPATGGIVEINEPGCRLFGYAKADIIGRSVDTLSSGVHPYTQETAVALNAKARQGRPQTFEWQCRKKSGELFWTEISLRSMQLGPRPTMVAVIRDITERKELSERFRQIAETITEIFWISSRDKSAMLYVSPGYEAIWGRSCESLYENPRQWIEAIHEEDRERVVEKANRQEDGDYNEEYRIVRPDGEVRWIADRAFPVHDDDGNIRRIAGTARDITKRKGLSARIEHMAHHDALTGLPNRFTLTRTLGRAIARSRHTRQELAILSLDLDHFKDVNDTRGHLVGDRLLQLVAERLLAGVRRSENVARFGGDEFAILLDDSPDPERIAALASRLIASISKPYLIDGIECHVGASIGVAIFGKDGNDVETLMSNADIALYRAKADGRETYRFFSQAMHDAVQARVRLTNELRLAIPNEQLFLVYQPQVGAKENRIVGVEALVRWRHPTRGTLAPDEFLPVAETSGLIGPLGEWVLREACRQGRRWIDAGISPGTVSVNLASAQFKDPLALEELVLATLRETGLPPHALELEITEGTLVGISSQHEKLIQRLRNAGVRFALDDFGTGNSSLNHLRRFPVDRIKIASEFISGLASDARTASIVKLVIDLARELGNDVMAEGVETPEQLGLLQKWNCPDIQGFYFATPMPAKAVERLLNLGKINVPGPDAASSAA